MVPGSAERNSSPPPVADDGDRPRVCGVGIATADEPPEVRSDLVDAAKRTDESRAAIRGEEREAADESERRLRLMATAVLGDIIMR